MALDFADGETQQIIYEHHWDDTWVLKVRSGTVRLATSRKEADMGGGQEFDAGEGLDNWTPHRRWWAHAPSGAATLTLRTALDFADAGGQF